MEQSPQLDPSASLAAQEPGDEPDQASGEEALRQELAKWRERVPKLAAALRQRSEEAETLKEELDRVRRAQGGGENVSAGIKARDELIEELERKLADLQERHKAAQGELHQHQLEARELKGDVDAWKGKWQALTRSLDQQEAEASARGNRARSLEEENESLRRRLAEQVAAQEAGQRALDEAVEERDSLRRRNEQLFETTELANRQIGSLTDSLSDLRGNLKQMRERETELTARLESREVELEQLGDSLTEAEARALQQAEELHLVSVAAASGARSGADADARVAEAERARQQAEERLARADGDRAAVEASLKELTQEVTRLNEVVAAAQRTIEERERERRGLSEQIEDLESRHEHLEQQLAERSELVINLERDQAQAAERLEALQGERDELEEALRRSERHVKENTDYITGLDAKLERQKELNQSLEEELAEAQEELVQSTRKAEALDASAETARLQDQIRKLEALVRERTEALNRLSWQQEVSGREGRHPDQGDAASSDDPQEKLLVVLNQQLTDARSRNDELLVRIRELEERFRERSEGSAVPSDDDDLTRIHGVGQKLAEQLNELGIHRYAQIAELDEQSLEDEGHVLHVHRGRIVRDGWIEQAVRLISH